HQSAEEGADDGARTTSEQRTANHGGGNAHEHDFVAAGQRIDRADTERIEYPGHAAKHAAHDEIADADTIGLDAHLGRAGRVTAGGDGMQAPAAFAEHNLIHDRDDNGP